MVSSIKAFKQDPHFKTILISTSQHKQLLSDVISLFKLNVNYDLRVMRKNQGLSGLTARLLKSFDSLFKNLKPDLIFVQGDTTSSMTAALSAFYKKIPVAHIEAGLRTGDIYSPFPEEINRIYIDMVSEFLFPPTKKARKNLADSGIKKGNILITGNTGIDALLMTLNIKTSYGKKITGKILDGDKIILMTTHRRESFGKPLQNIIKAIIVLAGKFKEYKFILPVHPNPNVKLPVYENLKGIPNIILTDPLPYTDFIMIMKKAFLIISDSGGIQEEAPVLGKPVVVLREKTERVEAVKNNAAILTGHDKEKIITTVSGLIRDRTLYKKMSKIRYLYGDGKAGSRIYKFIKEHL
ncbi:MAG TPA: UDP-N-acetylglucosamine 2-epimerase (non-hydrolyzing) [Firmicutes bacterium]|nr:UDP-N-acetylglucosamine 2-epimerase (non-hydrolyzing) [Bacillota bacterium]